MGAAEEGGALFEQIIQVQSYMVSTLFINCCMQFFLLKVKRLSHVIISSLCTTAAFAKDRNCPITYTAGRHSDSCEVSTAALADNYQPHS